MSSSLRSYLDAHRVKESPDWNFTGMGGDDKGTYHVPDNEYDTFLSIVHSHIFGRIPRASSLLERHRDVGPLLIDLDLRYETGGPLVRRFAADHVRNFIAEYAAAMVYLSHVETLPQDLIFYHMEKPAPETDKNNHKDGVHIQCPTISTTPKYQYGIRGFLLNQGVTGRAFENTGVSNPPEDVYDVSVIHRNNWFLYGACKPNKPQYRITRVWRLRITDIVEALDGGDPTDYTELVDIVRDLLTEEPIPTDSLEIMKTLSIRRNHTTAAPLGIRSTRAAEWEELMICWGSGKAKSEKMVPTAPAPTNTLEDRLLSTDENEDSHRVTHTTSAEDITLAYRLCRECINPEKRMAEYSDWVSMAICLKNIANTDESFKAWCDLTRRVDPVHKKSRMSDMELRAKWNVIRIDNSRKLRMGSLQHWARDDNHERYRSIMSETHTDWIINYAKDTHVNVASFVCRLFEHEFRCSIGKRRGMYEWYQFVPGTHSWKHMMTSNELRARLSGAVKNAYVEAGKRLSDKLISSTDDTERDRIDERRKKMYTIERQLEMSSFKNNVLNESQEKFYDEEFIKKLDANTQTVGVANGVLELRHKDDISDREHVFFREGLPDDYISFQIGRSDPTFEPIPYIPYDPNQPEQKELMQFFERIYPDPVLREYVLTLFAACLEGENREQKFYVLQGVGSNGKSMIEKLMEITLGDYATTVSTTIITRKRPDGGAANADLITVKNTRFIHMSEPDEDEQINTATMKSWTGGDKISMRGLFSDQEKLVITGRLFMSCNELPPVNKMDNGTWRRLRVIPHVTVFKDPGNPDINPANNIFEKDLNLEHKMKQWRVAFLSLLVHYFETRYLAHDLKEPDCVVAASNKYKEVNDVFSKFFTENFVSEPGAGPITAKQVRELFRAWRKALGKECGLKENVVMERMKVACGSGSTEKEFWGVRILEDEAEDISGALIQNMP